MKPVDAIVLAMCAEDMFRAIEVTSLDSHARETPDFLSPPLDPRLTNDWRLVAYIIGKDAIGSLQQLGIGERSYYGFLAVSVTDPMEYVAVARGTETRLEWLIDAEGVPVPHSTGQGFVEQGFYSIYRSLSIEDKPAFGAIAQLIPPGASVTAIGHSLGAALASYLLLDLVRMSVKANGLFFASPKPGDARFAYLFSALPYQVYNYIRDMVPHSPLSLPFGFGFQSLQNVTLITPTTALATIPNDILQNHRAINYAKMLGYTGE